MNKLFAPGNLWIACKVYVDQMNKVLYYKQTGKIDSELTRTEANNFGLCQGYILGVMDSNYFYVIPGDNLSIFAVIKKYVRFVDTHEELQIFDIPKNYKGILSWEIINKIVRESDGSKCLNNNAKGYVLCNPPKGS